VHIYNFHGVPRSGKRDTPERDIQTARVLARMSRDAGGKILVGDFNLMPDTQAIRSFEQKMRNLVVEGKFSTTRTHHYGNIASQPFADYAFVSPGIKVRRFEVLSDEVSDHRALELDVSE
jgi:endonuclease/exonuclease/phosphatase (EEP) superfamily protein YafD